IYSLPSASKMCEPCPRTMKGASPPTEPKARTGEFTPPGIICSARCCSLRDISVLRAMGSPKNWSYIVTAGGRNTAKSQHWEMHLYFLRLELSIKRDTEFTGYLQFRNSPETRSGYSLFSTRPSNREGFKDSFGGLRAVLIFCRAELLQVRPNQADQILAQLLGRIHRVIRIHHVQADVVFQDLRHQAVDTAANRGQEHENVGAFVAGSEGALDRCELAADSLDAEQELLFLFGNFGNFIAHCCLLSLAFPFTIP